MAPSGISYSDIAAWQTVHGVQLSPWELDSLSVLDRMALESARAKPTPPEPQPEPPK